jgi:hypothetical protein
MKNLRILSILIGFVAIVICFVSCSQQAHDVVRVSLTWDEQEWVRDIEFYKPCEGGQQLKLEVPFMNMQVRGKCAKFSVVYNCK